MKWDRKSRQIIKQFWKEKEKRKKKEGRKNYNNIIKIIIIIISLFYYCIDIRSCCYSVIKYILITITTRIRRVRTLRRGFLKNKN